MGDYSWVKDKSGNVCGIWLKDPSAINKPGMVEILLMKDNCQHLLNNYLAKRYRKVTNNYDSTGGCFVMFGLTKAPGEE